MNIYSILLIIAQVQVSPVPTSAVPTSIPSQSVWEEFMKGNSWAGIATLVSLLIGLIGTGITIYTIRKQRNRKLLGYEVRSDSPLLNFSEIAELKGRLNITFDGSPVEKLDINSVEFRISNSGDVPLGGDDFKEPILFNFGDTARVLTATVARTEPIELKGQLVEQGKEKVRFEGSRVLLEPILLNKGWSITIRTLVTQKDSFRVYAPIAGVELRDLTNYESAGTPTQGYISAIPSSILGVFGFLSLLILQLFPQDYAFWSPLLLLLVLVTTFIAPLVAGLFRPATTRKSS